ncbi:purine-nucleoside phosphorylase [Saccharopolyspora halophila]|uniref:Purine nucleoside phosphorylase n=1 Tax=Saccharopolyspora halophila TaxID=405551 RepID=A0ABN3FW33_9PSEU
MTPTTNSDPTTAASTAAAKLTGITGIERHDMAVVLGSGWQPAADRIGEPDHEFPMSDLPGFARPGAVGHSGKIRSVQVGDKRVLIMLGRTHLYEGHGIDPVAHGVRTAAAAGCGTIVLTNAAGGLREGMQVGQPVLISDHINMTAKSPLVGADFVDMTHLYSPRLRELARTIDDSLQEGVYAGMPGPHFETPAEIRMLRGLGVDLVGMSTVVEAIAARAAGAEVFGLSLVTNLAAGLSGQPLDHEEVLEAGRSSANRMGDLLKSLLEAA